jgi:recombinational DNA repair protein RecR
LRYDFFFFSLENAVNEFAKLPGIGKKQLCGWYCTLLNKTQGM